MPGFRIAITNLDGEVVAQPFQFESAEVVVPLNDSRTARVTLSMHDPVAQEILPLKRLLKVYYGTLLVFWGYITQPIWDAQSGLIEVNAHDPTLKLKHHFHRYGDWAVDFSYPLDGIGMRILLESTIPIQPQLDRGVIGNGIEWGTNTVTPQPEEAEGGLYRIVQRGMNVWESVLEMTKSAEAPMDFEFEPQDGLGPGYFCVINTANYLGVDKTDVLPFHFGYGADNLENFIYQPDGDATRNYWVAVHPGGDTNRDEADKKALYHDEDSWLEYGIYQGWESSQQKDYNQAVLAARAQMYVEAYATPPEFFSITPRADAPGVPVFGTDYAVGDTIKASVKRGYLVKELTGRVVQATLAQTDSSGNVGTQLEMVPAIASTPVEGDEGGTY
jgi:hypothetical protein